MTCAPISPKNLTVSLPIPVFAPVTIATWMMRRMTTSVRRGGQSLEEGRVSEWTGGTYLAFQISVSKHFPGDVMLPCLEDDETINWYVCMCMYMRVRQTA